MRVVRLLRSLFWDHPVFWAGSGFPLFFHLSRLPVESWNVEILIARNLLNGFGFVDTPLDPPALWRPPLAVAFLLPIQMLFRDPHIIYAIFGSLTLVGFLVAVFYLMKMLGGPVAAHFSPLLLLSIPAYTVLVSHQLQLVSYLLLFGLVTLAILTTIWSWQRSSWKRDFAVGFIWGLAFLTRPEAILLFAVSVGSGFLFHRMLKMTGPRALQRFLLQVAAFSLIYIPSVMIFGALQSRYGLVGQESLVTYYAGAHFASNQLAGDIDGEGYLETVQRYGNPAQYHYSMIRFMLAQPKAIYVRVGQNLSTFKRLIDSHRVLNSWEFFAFLVLGSCLVFARAPAIPLSPLLAYMTALLMASPYFLTFHVDVRYTLLFILVLTLWLLVVALAFWTWVGSRLRADGKRRWLCLVPTLALVVLCVGRLDDAIATAREESVDLAPWQQLATSFRASVGPAGTPVVLFVYPDGTAISGGDFLWFSYFAKTAVPWCGSPNCDSGNVFPRSKIYSFQGKFMEYMWTTDELAPTVAASHEVLVQHLPLPGIGSYSLLKFAAN